MCRLSTMLLVLSLLPVASGAQTPTDSARAGVESFNRALGDATRRMDNAALSALWEEDGVSLLPSTKPIVGRTAIAKFISDVTASIPHAQMELFESECFDIEVSGDWASEWCTEHQRVAMGIDKPPFEGWGKMLFVLHRNAAGEWKLKREMWNQALPPTPAAR